MTLSSVTEASFPRTRYLGSKRKSAATILECLAHLDFDTVLDAFGGTAAVSHAFKAAGKRVTYCDILAFNHLIGVALIENDVVRLSEEDISEFCAKRAGVHYDNFIERTFDNIYFTAAENHWLDVAAQNIRVMACPYRRALAWYAVFQSAMAKRPYNLFHRKNLYMRTAAVQRSFGNKASWDRPFDEHVRTFAAQANRAIIDGKGSCRAVQADALTVAPEYDLVYIDTPYISAQGAGVDYRDYYHFLEGMVSYDDWPNMIDRTSKHLRLARIDDPWADASRCEAMFQALFDHHRRSILAVSYRNDGTPTVDQLTALLRQVKRRVVCTELGRQPYALSTRKQTAEVLIVAT